MPEAKPRDINVLRVLSLLDDDKSTLLVPETKSRDTNMPFIAYGLNSLSYSIACIS